MKLNITQELARLHAHICADGCIYKVRCNRSKNELIKHPRKMTIKTKYYIRYYNNNTNSINQFVKDLKIAFNRKGIILNSNKNIVYVDGKWLYDILRYLGARKSHEWFISKKIMSSSNDIIIEWIKAFFDDEAYVPLNQKCIKIGSVNKDGLGQIKRLLFHLGIESNLRGPYWYKEFFSYRLYINSNNTNKYYKLIGFNSSKKKNRLKKLIKKMGTSGLSK